MTDGGVPALSVKHLSKRFGDRLAVDDVSFEVGRGEVFGFLGPNGAGKTTTVRTLGTLIAPTSGSATVAGIRSRPRTAWRSAGGSRSCPRRRASTSASACSRTSSASPTCTRCPTRALASSARSRDGPQDRADDPCGTLSKGLRQRVALARALLSEPEVLFLDEPTAGLDPVAAREVHELIVGLRQRGVTIFLTTHRLEEAERLCDRVAILKTTLRSIGRPDELRDQLFARTLTVRTLAPLAGPTASSLGFRVSRLASGRRGRLRPDGVRPERAAPAVTRALVAAGADVLSIERVAPLARGRLPRADRRGAEAAPR